MSDAKERARELRDEGVVRIENFLPMGFKDRFADDPEVVDGRSADELLLEIVGWRYTCDEPPTTNRAIAAEASDRLGVEPAHHPTDGGRRRVVFYLTFDDTEVLVAMHHEEGTTISVPENTDRTGVESVLTGLHDRLVQGELPYSS